MRSLVLQLSVEVLRLMAHLSGPDVSESKRVCRLAEFSRPEMEEIRQVLAKASERCSIEHEAAAHLSITKSEGTSLALSMLTFVLQTDIRQACWDSAKVSPTDKAFHPTAEAVCEEAEAAEPRPWTSVFCPFCEDFLCQPTTLACGHSYCASCLDSGDSVGRQSGCATEAENAPCLVTGCSGRLCHRELRINHTLSSVLTKWFPRQSERVDQFRRGQVKMQSGDYSDAAKLFSGGLTVDPDDYRLLSQRSLAFLRLGQFHESGQDAERCVRLAPHLPEGYHRRGMVYAATNHLDRAILDYLHCARLQRAAHEDTVEQLASVLQEFFRRHVPGTQFVSVLARLEAFMTALPDSEGTSKSASTKLQCNPLQTNTHTLDDALCPLCYRLLYQPLTTPCGHVFCRTCLYRSLDQNANCPWCRFSLAEVLAEQRQSTTMAIEYLLQTLFVEEYEKRRRGHLQELGVTLAELREPTSIISIFVCAFAFPEQPCPLYIFEPRYRLMIRRCLESGSRQFGMCFPCADGSSNSYSQIGTLIEVTNVQFMKDGNILIDCLGKRRFQVLEEMWADGYNTARVRWITDEATPLQDKADLQEIHDETFAHAQKFFRSSVFEQIRLRIGNLPAPSMLYEYSENGPGWLWFCISVLPLSPQFRLNQLSCTSVRQRLLWLRDWFVMNDNPFSILAIASFLQHSYTSP